MAFQRKWHVDLLCTMGVLFFGLFVWVGFQNVDGQENPSIKGYGGRLPEKTRTVLERMNEEIRNTKGIIDARSERIRFLSKSQDVKEYCFAYGILWYNDIPVISDVQFFRFEYRDEFGNLLTRVQNHLLSVTTIVYTLRMGYGNKEVRVSSRLKIPFCSLDAGLKKADPMTWAVVPNK